LRGGAFGGFFTLLAIEFGGFGADFAFVGEVAAIDNFERIFLFGVRHCESSRCFWGMWTPV
jgi:hypothetical protein